MQQIITGLNDMMKVNIIHRDLKLENIMIHFPGKSQQIINMSKEVKKLFLKQIDLDKENFVVKIADLGFSKKLKEKE